MVVSAIGALIGILKAAGSCLFAISVGIGTGSLLTKSFLQVVLGSNVVLIVFCVLALIGAVLAGRGRSRAGATFLLASAAGVVAATVLYVLLFASIMAPINEVDPGVPTSPGAGFYLIWLAPVPLLLAAAALSFFIGEEGTRTSDVS